jgi:hypothetical protein
MAICRIRLADGARQLQADLKALSEDNACSAAGKLFGGARWRVVEVRRPAD